MTKNDPQAQGQHRYIPLNAVASVEQDVVQINVTAKQAMGGGSTGQLVAKVER